MKKVIPLILALTAFFYLSLSAQKKKEKERVVLISTEFGDIKLKLYNETPKHRDNFIKLAKEGFFDGTLFHRVIGQFMIQGGDPDSKNAGVDDVLGNGGPGYTIPAEFNPALFHKKGVLAAARESDQINPEKASSGSQFYIVQGRKFTEDFLKKAEESNNMQLKQNLLNEFLKRPENKAYKERMEVLTQPMQKAGSHVELQALNDEINPMIDAEFEKMEKFKFTKEQVEAYTTIGGTPHLDGAYTVFGEVIDGLEVVDEIAKVETKKPNRPIKDIKIKVKVLK